MVSYCTGGSSKHHSIDHQNLEMEAVHDFMETNVLKGAIMCNNCWEDIGSQKLFGKHNKLAILIEHKSMLTQWCIC